MNPIQDLRRFLEGKTITEASKKLGVSRQTIYDWLKGKHGFSLKNYQKVINR
jgi:transposase